MTINMNTIHISISIAKQVQVQLYSIKREILIKIKENWQ